jgi:putative phosphoribosyl transferase
MLFEDRADAGRRLAGRLGRLSGQDLVVLGVPRGGVQVAAEVAAALRAPLDIIVVRKLGVPGQPEYAFGAIGEDGTRVIDRDITRQAGVTEALITAVEARERVLLDRLVRRLRGDRPPVKLAGRTVIIVDDGIATGSTAREACRVARARGARRVVLAAPVGPADSVKSLRRDADEVVCAHVPATFFAIGQWYDDFSPIPEEQVSALLNKAAPAGGATGAAPTDIEIDAAGTPLPGLLTVPDGAAGLVVFAHGSGSGRNSPRNQSVAATLNEAGLGTLLADLLTDDEAADRRCVFDIALLATRLTGITDWLRDEAGTDGLRVGYFGASTGAAAALRAAAAPRLHIAAVVSRGGRPDLAADFLAAVRAPTLLVVGGADPVVLDLNRRAQSMLNCENRLTVIPGATHLFEEPGALGQVAAQAADWFTRHLSQRRAPSAV